MRRPLAGGGEEAGNADRVNIHLSPYHIDPGDPATYSVLSHILCETVILHVYGFVNRYEVDLPFSCSSPLNLDQAVAILG